MTPALTTKYPRTLQHEVLVNNIKRGFYGADLISGTDTFNTDDKNYVWCYLENPFSTNAVIDEIVCQMLFDPATGDNLNFNGETILAGTNIWLPCITHIKLTSGKLILKRSKFALSQTFDALAGIINFDS